MLGVMNAPTMSHAEYVAMEAASAVKHEFIDGEVFAWGAPHGRESAFERGVLMSALSGALAHELRVLTTATELRVVRDAVVLLVTVFSSSTEAEVRGENAARARRLESLKEYVLVSQTEQRVEVQRRNERGIWELHFFGPGDHVELNSVGARLSVDALYANPLQ